MRIVARGSVRGGFWIAVLVMVLGALGSSHGASQGNSTAKQPVRALYIPLADHYAALVAYERYGHEMVHADLRLEQMKNWDLLRAYFQSGEVDMYLKKPNFRWIGLMHRDGNALVINSDDNAL